MLTDGQESYRSKNKKSRTDMDIGLNSHILAFHADNTTTVLEITTWAVICTHLGCDMYSVLYWSDAHDNIGKNISSKSFDWYYM